MSLRIVPTGQLIIARRFNAGIYLNNEFSPEGTAEIDLQGWWFTRPVGTFLVVAPPAVKTAGYCHSPRWGGEWREILSSFFQRLILLSHRQ